LEVLAQRVDGKGRANERGKAHCEFLRRSKSETVILDRRQIKP